MSEILLDTQIKPTTPPAGQNFMYPDSITKIWTGFGDDAVAHSNGGILINSNTADVVANAADTYLTGGSIVVPNHLLQAKTVFRWLLAVSKTAAGVATPAFTVRFGTAGTTADTAVLTLTGPAQTANADVGLIEIVATLRNTGAAGVMSGVLAIIHNLAGTTGLANVASPVIVATGAGFTTTTAAGIVGLSCNPGAAGVWTFNLVSVRATNI